MYDHTHSCNNASAMRTFQALQAAVTNLNKSSSVQFHPSDKLFEIDNSLEISPKTLQKECDKNTTYILWEPLVETTRSLDGNLYVKFVTAAEKISKQHPEKWLPKPKDHKGSGYIWDSCDASYGLGPSAGYEWSYSYYPEFGWRAESI